MSIYENLVMQTQMNYSRYYGMYMAGKSPYKNSNKVIPYKEQIHIFAKQIQNAECIIVEVLPVCPPQEEAIFITKTTNPIENILNHLQINTILKVLLLACSTTLILQMKDGDI